MLEIKVKPRFHCGLISLHSDAYRKFGGVGFAIQEPSLTIKVNNIENGSGQVNIKDNRAYGLSIGEKISIERKVNRIIKSLGLDDDFFVNIEGELLPHIGLGSGTSTVLGIIESISILKKIELKKEQIQLLSRRGGTSGVGIESYFNGGAVLDIGHLQSKSNWLPSSDQVPKNIPLTISRADVPIWPITMIIPENTMGAHGAEERDFFKNNLPLNDFDSFYSCYHSVFGIYGSIIERDFNLFSKSLNKIQQSEWKKREISRYPDLKNMIEKMNDCECGSSISMSSMGPCMIYVGDGAFNLDVPKGFRVLDTYLDNTGREISYA